MSWRPSEQPGEWKWNPPRIILDLISTAVALHQNRALVALENIARDLIVRRIFQMDGDRV